jgi:hypothetical protein
VAQRQISARRQKRKVGTRQQIIIDEVGPTVCEEHLRRSNPESLRGKSLDCFRLPQAFGGQVATLAMTE